MRLTRLLVALLFLATPLQAECVGRNLITALPPDQLAALRETVAGTPFAHGNLWHATRGDEDITVIGTFHLDDPRHEATVAALTPALETATALLVEAGPAEEDQIRALLAREPQRMLITTGPTLPEALPADDWQRLADALRARGIPPFMAAKLKPWYLSTMLAVPACNFADLAASGSGLDLRLMAAADALNLPILGLEPFDTVFTAFDKFPPEDQLAMLMQSLATEIDSEDMALTLADAYFAGDSRLFWEFSRQQTLTLPGMTEAEVNREFALVESALMTDRNATWIPVIEAAAAKGPIVVAFGALHLSGATGVLELLQQEGYEITAIAAE